MKKLLIVALGLSVFGNMHAAVTLQQGVAAYDLMLNVPVVLKDMLDAQTKLETRQKNMDVLFKMCKEFKNAKKAPTRAISVTSYLAFGEVKALIDNIISILDIIQNKIILKIGTVINNNTIGAPLSKVTDMLIKASDFLTTFVETQQLVVMLVDAEETTLNVQKAKLQAPFGIDIPSPDYSKRK